MLSVLGRPQRVCNGMTRRELLEVGGAGLLGLSLPKVLSAEAAGPIHQGRAKSVLFVYLFGGPSQLETFDMKPNAPAGIRGPFQPIASRTPELRICEHLPQLAQRSDQYCVVRTMNHKQNDHNGCHYIQTGHPMPPAQRGAAGVSATEKDWPAMGSIVEYLDQRAAGGQPRMVPSYIYLPNRLGHIQGYDRSGQYAGWLGSAYDALATDIQKRDAKDNPFFRDCNDDELDFRIKGLADKSTFSLDRLDRRRSLLEQFESSRREMDAAQQVAEYDGFREAAMSMVSSGKLSSALDIQREPANIRDRYGRHLFGQSLLMGRRMLEVGARFVTVLWDAPDGYSWDSHRNSESLRKYLLPGLDQSLSALLDDLKESGLLDETLVVCVGEMGRGPKANSQWGRGHWSFCFPALLAGAGIRGGTLHGQSDKDAAYPIRQAVSPEDLACTIFDALGIDPHSYILDKQDRPTTLVHGGRSLSELFA